MRNPAQHERPLRASSGWRFRMGQPLSSLPSSDLIGKLHPAIHSVALESAVVVTEWIAWRN